MNIVTKQMSGAHKLSSKGMGVGNWTVLLVLLSLLAASMVVAYVGWTLGSEANVPLTGYVAMALGVVLSLAVGVGLMGLVFYSSRKGYDAPPVLVSENDHDGKAD